MHPTPVLLYPFRGENLKLSQLREKLENELGAIIDKDLPGMGPSNKLKVLAMLTGNHVALSALLSVTIDNPEGDEYEDVSLWDATT